MRINRLKVNKILSWITTVTLIIQVVLPNASFKSYVPLARAAMTITIVAPTNDIDWDIGNTETITWNISGGIPNYLKLFYSNNSGASWISIDDNVTYTDPVQNYSWVIPAVSGPGESDFRIQIEAWASLGPTLLATSPDNKTQITTDDQSGWPNIYDRIIVYESDDDIYMYNIDTAVTTQVTSTYTQKYPNVSADYIVWEDSRNGNWDIYMYTISTGLTTQVTTDLADQQRPAVYGNNIVWQDNRNGNWDIYMYTISDSAETQITSHSSSQYNADINATHITWTDYRNTDADIYAYNIGTLTEIQITTNSSHQTSPAIDGDNIVWQDNRNGNTDIYMYTISTSTETQITTNSSNQNFPAIHDNYITWQDNRNEPFYIDHYAYNLTTNKEFRVTTTGLPQNGYPPQIYADIIVYQEFVGGNYNVQMHTIDLFNIDYGPVDSFTVVAPVDSCNNAYFQLTATAKDQYGNAITNYADTSVSVVATTGPIAPTSIGDGTYGSWSSGVASYAYYLISVNGIHTIRVHETGGAEGTTTIEIKTCGGGPPPPPPLPGYPTSKVVGIVDSGGSLVTPMPAQMLTSKFTIVAEANDTGTPISGVASVNLYWSQTANGSYRNYGPGTKTTIAGTEYWIWNFSGTNGRYYFYSLATDNFNNIEVLPKPFWTGIITYDDTTVVSVIVPKILDTVPLDKQTDIGINTAIRVVFDYAMDKTSVEQSFSLKKTSDGSGNFRWNATWSNSNRTVIFSPVTGQVLAYNTDYTATIDLNMAKSSVGEPLAKTSDVPNPWTFMTAAQTTTNLSTSTKVSNMDIAAAGTAVTYTIVLRNSGTATANVIFSDQIPLNTVYNNFVSNAIWDSSNNRITWNGPLARNGSRTIQFRVMINQPLPNDTRITNKADISDGIKIISKYAITVVSSPLADITSTAPINNAQDIAISTTIRVIFSQTMDKTSVGAAFKVTETVGGALVTGWTAVWSNLDRTVVFSLPVGQTLKYFTSYTVLIDKTIAMTAKGAPIQETTIAPDPFIFVTAKQRVPDVTLSIKIANVDVAQPYDLLTYTITLRNSGTAVANVSFVDPIPVNTAYANYVRNATWNLTSNRITWNGTLAVNASRIITFRVRINLPLPNDIIITNAAEINDGFNPTIYRYATTLVQSPMAKIVLTSPMNSEVNVQNRPAIRVIFDQTMNRATVQTAFSVTKVSGNPGGPTTWNPVWSINDTTVTFTLSAGQALDYDSVYNAVVDPAVAKTRKGASLDSAGPISNPWTFTTAKPNVTDSVKPVNLQVAPAGQQLTYNIVIKNNGTAPANIVFQDKVPVNTTYYSVSGANWDSVNQRIWWNGILAVGASRPVAFGVTIKSPLPNGTIITNAAEINDGFNPVVRYAQTIVQSPLSQILITSPTNGEMTVPIRPTIRMTFSKPMDRVLTQSAFSLIKTSGGTPDPNFNFVYAWATGDTVMTITLATGQSLAYSATYQTKIDPDIAKTKLGAPVDPASPATNPWTFNTALLNTPNLTTSTKGVSLPVANPGGVLLYTVILRNTSDFPATINIDDYVPANTSYNNYRTGVWIYDAVLKKMTLKNRVMSARSTLTMTYQVKVNAILPTGTIIHNEVLINDGKNPIFSKIAETYIQAHTDFATSYKSATNDNPERPTGMAEPGDTLTFTISVNNTGDMDAVNTYITDLVPPNTSFVEGSASDGLTYDAPTRTLQWLGTVPILLGKTLTFKAIVDTNKDLFQPPSDKVINDAVITDITNSFAVKSSTTIVPGESDGGGGGGNPNNPPYLMEVEPAEGTKSVKLYSPIVLKFSENVVSSTLQYIVRTDDRLVDTKNWVVEEDISATLTLRPNKPLASGSIYTIQVVDVVDTTGKSLGIDGPIPNNTFSFSTVRPRLYFVDKQILRFKAGTISSAIEVKLGNWINYDDENAISPLYDPYTVEDPAGIVVRLWGTSATGKFDLSPTGTFDKSILDLTMLKGSDSLTVYYTDSAINTPLIYKLVAYPPYIYPLYLVYSDERLVQTNDGSGGTGSSQNRIEFITENQNVPMNFLSNPIEFEIRSPEGKIVMLKAGKSFLLGSTSGTGGFYNSYKLPLDDIMIIENRNYYRMALPADSTQATLYYKDSTPGPYIITVKDEGISIAAGDGPAIDGNQTINIVPLKDQDIPTDKKLIPINDDSGRKLGYITVEPTDTVLMPGAKQSFTGKGFDTDGKEITSLQFGWYVIAGGGTVSQPITGSNTATFTAGRTPGVYYDTVMAATMYNDDLMGGYATVRVARVLDYGWGNLPSTGPNGIQVIFIILMLLSAVALAEVEHYEKTHFPAKKPKFSK